MSISNENCDLGYNTEELRACGKEYRDIGGKLRTMAKELNNCLVELKESGWTTGAGAAFQEMAQVNWEENIDKYADFLETLEDALNHASTKYETLSSEYLDKLKLKQ